MTMTMTRTMTNNLVIRVVAISDTHSLHRNLVIPQGDVLIHAGDFTRFGKGLEDFNEWLGELDFEEIYVVCGNHENPLLKPYLAPKKLSKSLTNGTFLHNRRVSFKDKLNIYGFGWSFDGQDWSWPADTHIVITHQAPQDIMGGTKLQIGCASISKALSMETPILHIFGHHHHEYGTQKVSLGGGNVLFANASSTSGKPKLNPPHVFDVIFQNDVVVVDVVDVPDSVDIKLEKT